MVPGGGGKEPQAKGMEKSESLGSEAHPYPPGRVQPQGLHF